MQIHMENSISILDRAKRAEGPLEREREREREREGQRPVVRGGQWGSSLEEVSFSPFFCDTPKGRVGFETREFAETKITNLWVFI